MPICFIPKNKILQKRVLLLLLVCSACSAHGQFGAGIHQSNLPFVGFFYEINNRLRPELRISLDTYFEDLSAEGVLCYDVVNNENYEFYAGLGGRINDFSGLVIPLGLNVYPLSKKALGVHLELAPIIGSGNLLRGSWGIRYRFGSKTD